MPKTQITRHRAQARALADISRSALCYHSNETRAPIANPPNTAQLEGTSYYSPKLHPGPCSSVGMQRGTDRQTHRRPTAGANKHYASATSHVKCNKLCHRSQKSVNVSKENLLQQLHAANHNEEAQLSQPITKTKLSYHRGTEQHSTSVEIVSTVAQMLVKSHLERLAISE